MLTSIHIHEFRSCNNVFLSDLSSLLVLVGRNGAGKTNILQAIDWAARNVTSAAGSAGNGKISVEFEVDKVNYEYSIAKNYKFEAKKSGEHIVQVEYSERLSIISGGSRTAWISREGEKVTIPDEKDIGSRIYTGTVTLRISDSASFFVALESVLPSKSSIRKILSKISRFFSAIRYYDLEQVSESKKSDTLITFEDYEEWISKDFPEKSGFDDLHYKLLYLNLKKPSVYLELMELLGENGLDLIGRTEIMPLGGTKEVPHAPFYIVLFKTSTQDNLQLSQLSFGTKRILGLLVALFFDDSKVSLIEQPEDGIHFGLLKKLMPLIRAYSEGRQFVMASHSAAILNSLSPEEVRIVEIENGKTCAKPLSAKELSAARNFLENEGSFADFLESI